MIGKHESSSAFVYGCYSFFDKLANGLILFFMTAYMLDEDHVTQIQLTMGLTPILCSIFAYVATVLGSKLYKD